MPKGREPMGAMGPLGKRSGRNVGVGDGMCTTTHIPCAEGRGTKASDKQFKNT